MNITSAFYTVSNEVRHLQLMDTENQDALKNALSKFEKSIKKTDPNIVSLFVDSNYEELCRIVRELRKRPDFRAFHDRIFTQQLQFQKRIPTPLTQLFQEFVKGVTYFQHQAGIEVPIYHRLYACGPGDDAFRREFQQCSEDTEWPRLEDVKTRIETCYIERLVYDTMYKEVTLHFPYRGDEMHTQDTGHQYRLQITKEDFATCFPNLDIEIQIQWDMQMPVMLSITRRTHGKVTSVERYKKTVIVTEPFGGKRYDPYVSCFRETQSKKYYRTQRYDYTPKWKEL